MMMIQATKCDSSNKVQRTSAPCDSSLAQDVSNAQSATPESIDLAIKAEYQSIVGALLYCAVSTRPDIAYSVNMLCRVMSKPNDVMLRHAKRVLCYLHRHKDVGLTYEPAATQLVGYSDADWGVKHSTTGWIFKWMNGPIAWSSRKQSSVALSTAEAEIMAASETTKEAVYLKRLLSELGFDSSEAIKLYVDNKAAIDLAYNPEHHERSKHIARRHFFIREKVEDGDIVVPFVKSELNEADFFTKWLPPKIFFAMRKKVMNIKSN